VDKERN
jgi:hypothetical protein